MAGETKEISVEARLSDSISAGLAKIDQALLNTAKTAKVSSGEMSSALSDAEKAAKKEATTVSNDLVRAHEKAGDAATKHAGLLGKLGGGVSNFISTVAGFTTAQIGVNLAGDAFGFLGDSIDKAMEHGKEAQQIQASLNASLQMTGKTTGVTSQMANQLADSLSGVTTYSANTILSGESVMSIFQNISKKTFPEATKVALDLAAKLGVDVPTASRLLGRALNDPIKGVSQLTRYGITLSASQQNQIKNFMKTNNVAAAQGVILGALHGRLGDVAQAMGSTLSGRIQIMNNQWELLQEKVGEAVIPAFSNLLGAILPLVSWLADKLPQAVETVTAYFATKLAPVLDRLAPIIQTLVQQFGEKLLSAISSIASKGQDFVRFLSTASPALSALQTVLGIVAGAFTALAAKQVIFATISKVQMIPTLIEQAAQWWTMAAGVIAATWPILAIGAAVTAVVLLFKHWYDTNEAFRAAVDGLVKNTLTALNAIIQAARPYITLMMNAFEDLAHTISSKAQPVIASLVSFITQHMPQIEAVITAVLGGIKAYWSFIWPWYEAFAVTAFNVLKLTIGTIFNAIYAIIKVVTDLIQGHWQAAWQDIVNFARAEWQLIQSTIGTSLQYIFAAIKNSLSMIGSFMHGAWNGVLNVAQSVWNAIKSSIASAVQGLFNNIGSIMNGLHGAAIGWATGLRDGLVSGITGAWNAVRNALGGIVNNIVGFVKGALGIHSPSTVFKDIGTNMLLGMIHGFKGGDLAGHINGFINKSLGGLGPTIRGAVSKGLVSLNSIGSAGSALLSKLGLGNLIPNIGSALGGLMNNIRFSGGGNVQSWLLQALGITGEPASWLGPLALIAQHESGGNPNAINLWDINAKRGTPSEGLMQVIAPTFAANMLPGHNNIWDPVSNAIAAIEYIKKRYGSVFNVPGVASMMRGGPYVGYATGGIINEPIVGLGLRSGTQYAFGERGSEAVVPLNGRSSGSGAGGQIVVHNHIYFDGREVSNQVGAGMVQRMRTTWQKGNI